MLADFRYLSDGTKIGVRDAAGNGYEYLGSLIYRCSPNGLEIESTDFAGGRILKTSAKYDLRYFVRDYLGSVRAIVNAQGQRLEAIDYMPYGSRWKDPMRLVTDNRFLFNGKEWQPTGGLDVLDYGARQYDPQLGRWFNPDPVMQFLNPYTFCANDPVNLIDLNGMWTETDDSFFTNDPEEIAAFLNGNGDFGYLLDPTQKPQFTTESDNKQTNPNGDGGGGISMGSSTPTVMINGNWVEVRNSFYGSWTFLLWQWYEKGIGLPFIIDEEAFAYLLSKGELKNKKEMDGYYTALIDFYTSNIDLRLSFGQSTVMYKMTDGNKDFFYFHDTYDFNKGTRNFPYEIITRIMSITPGVPYQIIYLPSNWNNY